MFSFSRYCLSASRQSFKCFLEFPSIPSLLTPNSSVFCDLELGTDIIFYPTEDGKESNISFITDGGL